MVTPLAEVDSGLLESAIRTELRGTFFSISPTRARVTLKKLPWVRDVSVRRRWPLTLDVTVDEHRAVATGVTVTCCRARRGLSRWIPGADAKFDGPVSAAPEVLARYREGKARIGTAGTGYQITSDVSARRDHSDLGK